jgi:hypothetical protein
MKERFLSKFVKQDSGCWIWKAVVRSDGYGQFRVGPKMVGAHRVSYELFKGAIPQGMRVLHRCDNPLCVNPEHLFLGTQADNVADMVQKGRKAKGQKTNRTNLTEDDIRAIRAALGTNVEIAKRYGVVPHTISRIRTGARWGHV